MKLGVPPPIGNPNIAKPVPLQEADPQRTEVYKPLLEATNNAAPETTEVIAVPETLPWEPTAEDKKNFIRTMLGNSQYERSYKLFNGLVTATFKDRTTLQCEKLYEVLREQKEMNAFNPADELLWEARYHLAATLTKLDMDGRKPQGFTFPDEIPVRVKELMDNPSPLYQALMVASDHFERQLNMLIANARNDSFWQTDGTASH